MLAPAATENRPPGLAMTPAGKPVSDTSTEPAKPFCDATEMLTGEPVAPCVIETESVESTSEKSPGFTTGAGVTDSAEPPPQPQEYHPTRRNTEDTNAERAGESEKGHGNFAIPDEVARAREEREAGTGEPRFLGGKPERHYKTI